MHDLGIVEAQRLVPESRGGGVAGEVAVAHRRGTVVLAAVDLDDESTVDNEVDAADTGDRDLRRELHAEDVETEAQEGFQAAVRVGTGEVHEPMRGPGQRGADPGPCGPPDQSLPPG